MTEFATVSGLTLTNRLAGSQGEQKTGAQGQADYPSLMADGRIDSNGSLRQATCNRSRRLHLGKCYANHGHDPYAGDDGGHDKWKLLLHRTPGRHRDQQVHADQGRPQVPNPHDHADPSHAT